jgi:hypothetical protein
MNKLYCLLLVALSGFSISQPCYEVSSVCVDSSPSKYFNGKEFTLAQLGKTCWKYDKVYNCPTVDNCQSYLDKGCIIEPKSSICTETNSSGVCVSWKKTASCSGGTSQTNTMIACGNDICKPNSNGSAICYQADPTTDTDFGQAMAALEVANEMGSMKTCYDKYSGQKCSPTDPNDLSKGANPNCECFFFQGKFTTYNDNYNRWIGDPSSGFLKVGITNTNCSRVANQFQGNLSRSVQSNRLQATSDLPHRSIDEWSDKGQLNQSLTGNKDTTGVRAGNPYVYSFASSSKDFNENGSSVTSNNDSWATTNQNNSNYQIEANSSNNVISKDDPNATQNQTHWNTGGQQTGQGTTATKSSSMKLVQNAVKMVSDVLDINSAFAQTCSPEDQSKMINVGKNHCLFDYGGVRGSENGHWILYTFGDKGRWNYQNCTYKFSFWGALEACVSGQAALSTCKSKPECLLNGGHSCTSEFCYGQTYGGHGGADYSPSLTGGNLVLWKGNVNCCFASTISKIITRAAFEQGVGGRPKLADIPNYVAQFKGTEVCSVDELATGVCNKGNTGLDTSKTFQAMCEKGVTISDMQQIDFSKVDFSEFYAEANRSVNTNNFNSNSQTYNNQTTRVTNKIQSQKR